MTMLKRALKRGRKFLNPVPTSTGGLTTILKVLPLFLRNREEREPRTALGPFRTDARVYATPPECGLRVTWFGHSGMLLEIDGVRILIDPVWDERAGPVGWAGPKRFFAPTLPFEEMPVIDAVLVSHDHYDHLGKMTIQRLSRMEAVANAQWVTSVGVGKLLRGFGVAGERITELDWTLTVSVSGQEMGGTCQITSLPSRHFSGRSLFNRFETLWGSFAIRSAQHAVYYGADSGWWEGFAEIGAAYGPFDLTMLEIGAFNELWKDIHLGPDGAVRAYEDLGGRERAGLLMPIHWGLFNLALHAWQQPIQRLEEIDAESGLSLWSPEPGLPTEVVKGEPVRSDWWRT